LKEIITAQMIVEAYAVFRGIQMPDGRRFNTLVAGFWMLKATRQGLHIPQLRRKSSNYSLGICVLPADGTQSMPLAGKEVALLDY